MTEYNPVTLGELANMPDDECWQAYTKHEGLWSTKGAFLAALRIGRIQGREQAAKIAESNIQAPPTQWGKGAAYKAEKIAKAIRAL